ncbi:MAG: class I SAM-dependent methyltransferase [Gammaproteobacteria bacterium]|nr:class I SAM-dependent methyltransferase [Gammaproteobacteria bacterium]
MQSTNRSNRPSTACFETRDIPMKKSATDLHWNERALSERNPLVVNIADHSQRELETAFVLTHLPRGTKVLEVGCGNGFLTDILRQHCGSVDAFDYSENMVAQAKQLHGETNNRFFQDNVLEPAQVTPPYDAIVCVRVLINLRNLEEQETAVRNMHALLRPGGVLLLVEGYLDGFDALNDLRRACGIEAMQPASINFYSRFHELMAGVGNLFEIRAEMHTGTFDVLTRVAYPLLVGASNASGHSEFHEKILPLAKALSPEEWKSYARIRGILLQKP